MFNAVFPCARSRPVATPPAMKSATPVLIDKRDPNLPTIELRHGVSFNPAVESEVVGVLARSLSSSRSRAKLGGEFTKLCGVGRRPGKRSFQKAQLMVELAQEKAQ